MLKTLVKALGFALYERKQSVGFIAGLALSGAACALGMGGLNVMTSLGQPLKADIELVAVSKSEKEGLTARLASPEVFKNAGMEYPATVPQLKFKIETRENGETYLRVTTADPVNEPFVSMLVELSWSSGKLLREYTFLLDPPGFKPEAVKEAEVKPLAPAVVATPEPESKPAVAAEKSEPASMQAAAPTHEKAPVAVAPAKKIAVHTEAVSGDIKVENGDTLSKIANHLKPSDVSLERMLVALYRANTDVFDSKNMNRLKAGKILRRPNQSELSDLKQADAVKEIHVQAADWNAYRQKLAAASTAVTERAPQREASGKISATVADKAPAAKEPAKEVVRLSKGDAPSDQSAAGGAAKAAQDKASQQEEAIAKSKALKESSERIAMLEKNAKAMQRLIELKSQAAAKPEVKPEIKKEAPAKFSVKTEEPVPATTTANTTSNTAPPAVAATTVVPASAVEATNAAQPAKQAKRVIKPAPVAPPPSLLDEVMGEPLYMAGGAAGLLALGGLGFVLARRRKSGATGSVRTMGEGSSGSHILAPAAPSPETGDFTGVVTPAVNVMQAGEVDPISEADLFLNFGRDAQAEDILKDALGRNPASLPLMLKLMSIYANRKDTNSFSSYAQRVKDAGDAAAWTQAAEMGRKLDPNNALYGGAGGEQIVNEAPQVHQVEQAMPPVVDFDLGLSEPASAAITAEKTAGIPQVDFDLGFEEPQAQQDGTNIAISAEDLPLGEATVIEKKTGQAAVLDFDVTGTNPGLSVPDNIEQATSTASNVGEQIIDVAASDLSLPAITEEVAVTPEYVVKDDEFMLDFPIEGKSDDNKSALVAAQPESNKTMDIDLSEISLNLEEISAPTAAPEADAKDANWHDVATKLDLAKAYQEMGDAAGAREILDEVMREGDTQQRETAEAILKQLPT